jgi:hypothetical protein
MKTGEMCAVLHSLSAQPVVVCGTKSVQAGSLFVGRNTELL